MTILRSSSCNHTSAEHIALPPGCVGGHSNVLTTRAACDKAVTIAASVNVGANTTCKGLSVGKGASVLAYPPQAPSRNDRGGGGGRVSCRLCITRTDTLHIHIHVQVHAHVDVYVYAHCIFMCMDMYMDIMYVDSKNNMCMCICICSCICAKVQRFRMHNKLP